MVDDFGSLGKAPNPCLPLILYTNWCMSENIKEFLMIFWQLSMVGSTNPAPSPQCHYPDTPKGSQDVSRPERIYTPSREFWLCPGYPPSAWTTSRGRCQGGDIIWCLNDLMWFVLMLSSRGSTLSSPRMMELLTKLSTTTLWRHNSSPWIQVLISVMIHGSWPQVSVKTKTTQ